MTEKAWTPERAANRLARVVEAFCSAHGAERFPIDVRPLALDAANIFGWSDPISEVKAANIQRFEGALLPNEDKKKWLLLYNDQLTSAGRVRFTQAHELAHYILHRLTRESFQCSQADMLNWSTDERDIEAQADLFASYLLMPLNDYRRQINARVDLELLSHVADRYGVSLTAAILKWLEYTSDKAVIIMSNDGFLNWAWSSGSAAKAGAFFKTRTQTIPIPNGSLAANPLVKRDKKGAEVPATVWFPHADRKVTLREMKIRSDQYDSVLTLLCLPSDLTVWPPRDTE